ncbi:MAG: glycosyltransferase [Bacteriovoracaceae bacterium]|nr:glycosyltransferase [Bacteriovoracaceae bacterium]
MAEAIESAIAQTYTNWEIIFWDNASTDRTPEIAKSYTDSRFKYFRGEVNIPLYSARNLAIDKASGDFFAFLDSDDLWSANKLEIQMPLFDNPKTGLVYSDVYFLKNGENIRQLYKGRPYYIGSNFKELLTDYFLSLCSVVVRMECIKKYTKVFDDRFQIIGDADLFRRISFDGWEFDMIDKPLAKWRIHGDNLTFRESGKIISENELFLKKFNEIHQGFSTNYKKEIFKLRSNVAREEAKSLIGISKKIAARKVVKPFIVDFKSCIVFVLTFAPLGLSQNIIKYYYKKLL